MRLAELTDCVDRALALVTEEAAAAGYGWRGPRSPAFPPSGSIRSHRPGLAQSGPERAPGHGGRRRNAHGGAPRAARRLPRAPRAGAGSRTGESSRGSGPLQDWIEIEVADTGHGSPGGPGPHLQPLLLHPAARHRPGSRHHASHRAGARRHDPCRERAGRGTRIFVDLPEDKRRHHRRHSGSASGAPA